MQINISILISEQPDHLSNEELKKLCPEHFITHPRRGDLKITLELPSVLKRTLKNYDSSCELVSQTYSTGPFFGTAAS